MYIQLKECTTKMRKLLLSNSLMNSGLSNMIRACLRDISKLFNTIDHGILLFILNLCTIAWIWYNPIYLLFSNLSDSANPRDKHRWAAQRTLAPLLFKICISNSQNFDMLHCTCRHQWYIVYHLLSLGHLPLHNSRFTQNWAVEHSKVSTNWLCTKCWLNYSISDSKAIPFKNYTEYLICAWGFLTFIATY